MAPRCTRHEHRGPQDFRPNGRCLHCSREAVQRYQRSCRDARRLLKEIGTAAGEGETPPVDKAQLSKILEQSIELGRGTEDGLVVIDNTHRV